MTRILLMTLSLVFYITIMILNIIIIGDGLHKWFDIDHNFISVLFSGLLLFIFPTLGLFLSLICAIYAPNQHLFVYIIAYIPLLLIILDVLYAVPLPRTLNFENFNLIAFLRNDYNKQKPEAPVPVAPIENTKVPTVKRKAKVVKKATKIKKI